MSDRPTVVPVHKRPTSCYVCGWPEADHSPDSVWGRSGHVFVSNAEAEWQATEHDRRMTFVYPSGATTAEAAYVRDYGAELTYERSTP